MLIFDTVYASLVVIFSYVLCRWSKSTLRDYRRTPAERRYAKWVVLLSIAVDILLLLPYVVPVNGLFVLVCTTVVGLAYLAYYWYGQIRVERAHAHVE